MDSLSVATEIAPEGIKKYLYRKINNAGDKMAKAKGYENPIVAMKQVKATNESKANTENIVLLQSTGPTNICGVNNLPSIELYVTKRERGRGADKRT
jgi:hypothetical protein